MCALTVVTKAGTKYPCGDFFASRCRARPFDLDINRKRCATTHASHFMFCSPRPHGMLNTCLPTFTVTRTFGSSSSILYELGRRRSSGHLHDSTRS